MQQHIVPRQLGYLGLLPFIASSIVVWNPAYHDFALQSITIYAAVIVTFIGGVHWGLALQAQSSSGNHKASTICNQFIFSVIPSLAAWLAVVVAQPYSLIIIALCFVTFWYFEKTFFNQTFENWYATLRNRLTLVATTCIIIAWLGAQ